MALDPNKWTLKTQEAFSAAVEQTKALNNPEVTPDHLLAALLRQSGSGSGGGGITLPILDKVGVDPRRIQNSADEAVAKLPKAYGGSEPRLSRDLQSVMTDADEARTELGDEYLSVEHVLLALSKAIGVEKDNTLLLAAADDLDVGDDGGRFDTIGVALPDAVGIGIVDMSIARHHHPSHQDIVGKARDGSGDRVIEIFMIGCVRCGSNGSCEHKRRNCVPTDH